MDSDCSIETAMSYGPKTMGCDLLSLFAYCPWAHGTTSSYCREKGRRGRFLTFNRRPPSIPPPFGARDSHSPTLHYHTLPQHSDAPPSHTAYMRCPANPPYPSPLNMGKRELPPPPPLPHGKPQLTEPRSTLNALTSPPTTWRRCSD